MKIEKYLELIKAVGKEKAMALVNGSEIVDADGNAVDVETIDLQTAAPEQDEAQEESITADELKSAVDAAVKKAIGEQGKPKGPAYAKAPKADAKAIPATARRAHVKHFTDAGDGHWTAEKKAYGMGQLLIYAQSGQEKAGEWLKANGVEVKAQTEGSNSAGGVLVPDVFSTDIIRLVEQFGVFRQHARTWPMTRETASAPRVLSEGAAVWLGEGVPLTEADDTYDRVNLVAKKLGRLTKVSNELIADAAMSVGDLLGQSMAQKFAEAEDDAGFNGDGSSNYSGITGVITKINDGNHTASVFDFATGVLAFSDITTAGLDGAYGKLPQFAGLNPSWFLHKAGWANSILRLQNAAGGNTKADLGSGPVNQYDGAPVVLSQKLNSTLSDQASTVVGLVGDLSMAATVGDRAQLSIRTLNELYAATDETGVVGIERVDINVHDLGDTSSAGPIIALKMAAS
jgi:HK97 family phage major capsid protein